MSGSMNNVSIVEGDPSLNRSGEVHALRTPTTGESQAVSETLSLSEFKHCFFCLFRFARVYFQCLAFPFLYAGEKRMLFIQGTKLLHYGSHCIPKIIQSHKAQHIRLTAIQPQSPTYQTDGHAATKPNISDRRPHNHKAQHIRLTAIQPQSPTYSHKAQHIRLTAIQPQSPTIHPT